MSAPEPDGCAACGAAVITRAEAIPDPVDPGMVFAVGWTFCATCDGPATECDRWPGCERGADHAGACRRRARQEY